MIPIKYHFRSLFVRKSVTLMTLGSIAFVVLIYIGVLALAGGLRAAFSATGDPSTVLVIRDGAQSEMASGYETETHRILANLPGVLKDDSGAPLASGETMTIQIAKRRDGTETNVTIRGVRDEAFALRPNIEIDDGRRFEAGKGEVIIGSSLADRLGLGLGSQLKLGRLEFRIVGTFGGGGANGAEIWGDVDELGNAFQRTNYYSSTRLRAASPSAVDELIASAEGDQRIRVEAMRETEYYEQQTNASSAQFVYLGNALAVLMAVGACFAAANTMYSQVDARGREIGTLRALGFKRRTIIGGFLVEAVLLGLMAGGFGALLSLPLNAISTGTMNQATFSEITFQLRTTPSAIFYGVFLATITGVIGGLLPALSASRAQITQLLRAA